MSFTVLNTVSSRVRKTLPNLVVFASRFILKQGDTLAVQPPVVSLALV